MPIIRIPHLIRKLFIYILITIPRIFYPPLNSVIKRVFKSPGTPLPNPTTSYWIYTTPSPIASTQNGTVLPGYADVVIIGSGITGTSVAREILSRDDKEKGGHQGESFKVLMLDARGVCSGATGRNGGHISPITYSDYPSLKTKYGIETAREIIRFRLSHLTELLEVANEDGILEESQCRRVDCHDVYYDNEMFQRAKACLKEFQEDMPEESRGFRVLLSKEMEKLGLAPSACGCIAMDGGAIHPYRFVTGVLSRLLHRYPSEFQLFEYTPCTGITATLNEQGCSYTLSTPKGSIQTRHVIHATNAWTSHLLPRMRSLIIPARVTMSAQTPPNRFINQTWVGQRSFVFFGKETYDYLTQQPQQNPFSPTASPLSPPCGELMFGVANREAYLSAAGNVNDGELERGTGKYLSVALEKYFTLGTKEKEGQEESVRVKQEWTGLIAMSVDECPWVGKVPESIAGRRVSKGTGEWIAGGYTGEGMVHAWKCGKSLARVILENGDCPETIPKEYLITEERWKKSDFYLFLSSYL